MSVAWMKYSVSEYTHLVVTHTCASTSFAKYVSTAGDTKVSSLLGEALIAMKPIHVASGSGEAISSHRCPV